MIGPIVFKAFINEILRSKPKEYFNKKGVIQSSVGMIFKVYSPNKIADVPDVLSSPIKQVELLFTQRGGYEKDINAYNIVFPGGQSDGQQTDLQACKRQLFEQINLKVDQQCLYVGQLPNNFYYIEKRRSKLYISIHIWIMKEDQLTWDTKLNPDELIQSKWVSFDELIKKHNYIKADSIRLGIIGVISRKFKFAQKIVKNIKSVNMPELNLGMDRNLWGLTLWIWSYSLQMMIRNLKINSSQNTLHASEISTLESCIEVIKTLDIQFQKGYLLRYPIVGAIKIWHQLYRRRPFSYERKQEVQKQIKLILVFFFFCIICLSLNYIL